MMIDYTFMNKDINYRDLTADSVCGSFPDTENQFVS